MGLSGQIRATALAQTPGLDERFVRYATCLLAHPEESRSGEYLFHFFTMEARRPAPIIETWQKCEGVVTNGAGRRRRRCQKAFSEPLMPRRPANARSQQNQVPLAANPNEIFKRRQLLSRPMLRMAWVKAIV